MRSDRLWPRSEHETTTVLLQPIHSPVSAYGTTSHEPDSSQIDRRQHEEEPRGVTHTSTTTEPSRDYATLAR